MPHLFPAQLVAEAASFGLLVGGICLAAIAVLRWTGLSRPEAAGGRPTSPGARFVSIAALAAAAVAAWARGPILGGSDAAAAILFVLLLAAAVASRGLVRWLGLRDAPVADARRKAAGGDPDGAVADLLALLDRRLDRSPAPADAPGDDPWAAPRAPTAPDRGLARVLLALGAVEADRGRWADSLAWLDRAEAAEPAGHRVAGPRAAALAHLGRADEGAALLHAALTRTSAGDPTARGPLLAALAGLLIDRGQADAARPLLDEAEALWRPTVTFPPSTRTAALAHLAALRARLASPAAARDARA